MLARATTLVEILRDDDTEDYGGYGDTSEADSPVIAGNVPASIIEQTQRRPDPTTGNLVAVTALIGRVGSRTDVAKGDRIRDLSDGRLYAVVEVVQPQSPIRVLDKRLELEYV